MAPTDDLLRLNGEVVEATCLADRQVVGTASEVYNLRTETGNYFVSSVLVSCK